MEYLGFGIRKFLLFLRDWLLFPFLFGDIGDAVSKGASWRIWYEGFWVSIKLV
jgi:hypothetical protein